MVARSFGFVRLYIVVLLVITSAKYVLKLIPKLDGLLFLTKTLKNVAVRIVLLDALLLLLLLLVLVLVLVLLL